MARLLTKQQLAEQKDLDKKEAGEAILYLELRHTPYLNSPDVFFTKVPWALDPFQEHLPPSYLYYKNILMP